MEIDDIGLQVLESGYHICILSSLFVPDFPA